MASTASPPSSVKTAQLELERVQIEARLEHEQRQAMKRQMQAKLSLTQSKLDALEQKRQALEAEFLSAFDVPLEQAHVTMTRKTARRALQSQAFSEAYTRLLNMRVPKAAFSQPRNMIAHVSGNVFIDAITQSQAEMLDEVQSWIEDKQQLLQKQRRILDQLRQSSL